MALLRKGIKDINTEDPKLVNQAVADLQELYEDLQHQGGRPAVPDGAGMNKAWLNQAWSGDMLAAYFYYLPNKETGKLLRFWNPGYSNGPDRQRPAWCVLQDHQEAGARPPVPELHARQRRPPTRTSSTSTAINRR